MVLVRPVLPEENLEEWVAFWFQQMGPTYNTLECRCQKKLHYTDNDSCRFALMKGVGETFVARRLVASIMDREYALQTKSWCGRVPSHSNPSDDPSRGSFDALVARGSQLIGIPRCELLSCLPSQMGERTG